MDVFWLEGQCTDCSSTAQSNILTIRKKRKTLATKWKNRRNSAIGLCRLGDNLSETSFMIHTRPHGSLQELNGLFQHLIWCSSMAIFPLHKPQVEHIQSISITSEWRVLPLRCHVLFSSPPLGLQTIRYKEVILLGAMGGSEISNLPFCFYLMNLYYVTTAPVCSMFAFCIVWPQCSSAQVSSRCFFTHFALQLLCLIPFKCSSWSTEQISFETLDLLRKEAVWPR